MVELMKETRSMVVEFDWVSSQGLCPDVWRRFARLVRSSQVRKFALLSTECMGHNGCFLLQSQDDQEIKNHFVLVHAEDQEQPGGDQYQHGPYGIGRG